MFLTDDLVNLTSLIIVPDDLREVPLIAVNFLLHLFHNQDLRALLLVDALGKLVVYDLLDLLVVCVPKVKHLLVVRTSLVVLDVQLLLLQ